ncbi:MAG: gamma carbonic anhydrase family protein [Acidobacteria bacterium]|nr:gamma carbonic anhydrase family protein [Acidobacteriota bacterium]MBI3656134.1 gamma carbonic anhydrase family protein [Acidobacteriota bacterium]
MILIEFGGSRPIMAEDAFIAPTATLIGDVIIEAGASVQDNCVVHPSPAGAVIGEEATVGHGAILEGCIIGQRAVIGINAVVLEGATVGPESVIAAGSVVANNCQIPARTLAAGAPAQSKKEISGVAEQWVKAAAVIYEELSKDYRRQGIDKQE